MRIKGRQSAMLVVVVSRHMRFESPWRTILARAPSSPSTKVETAAWRATKPRLGERCGWETWPQRQRKPKALAKRRGGKNCHQMARFRDTKRLLDTTNVWPLPLQTEATKRFNMARSLDIYSCCQALEAQKAFLFAGGNRKVLETLIFDTAVGRWSES